MSRILENKAVCATLFVLFTLAILVNTLAGGALPAFGANPFIVPGPPERADSPIFPPDPWDRDKFQRADSPIFPPDPWDKDKAALKQADSPIFPPDPWDKDKAALKPVRSGDSPIFPPDPWDKDKVS